MTTRRFKRTEGTSKIRAISLNKDVEYIINIWHRNKNNEDKRISAKFIGYGTDESNLSAIVPKMKNSSGGNYLYFENRNETFKFEIINGACFTTNLDKNKRVTFAYDENALKYSYVKTHKDLNSYKYSLEEEKINLISKDRKKELIEELYKNISLNNIIKDVKNFVSNRIDNIENKIPNKIIDNYISTSIEERIKNNSKYYMNDNEIISESKFDFFTYFFFNSIRNFYLSLPLSERAFLIKNLDFYKDMNFKQVDIWIKNSNKKKMNEALSTLEGLSQSFHVYDDSTMSFIDTEEDYIMPFFAWVGISVMNNSAQRIEVQYRCFKTIELIIKEI